MAYANYICRVGALAVALGVGAAVATTPGISYATPASSGGSNTESSSATGDSTATGATSPSADSTTPDAPNPADGSAVPAGSPSIAAHDATSPTVTVGSSGGAKTSAAAVDALDPAGDVAIGDVDEGEQLPTAGEPNPGPASGDEDIVLPTVPTTSEPAPDPVSTAAGVPGDGSAGTDPVEGTAPVATAAKLDEAAESVPDPADAEEVSAAAVELSGDADVQPASTQTLRMAAVQSTNAPAAAVESVPAWPVSALTGVADTVFNVASALITAALGPLAPGGGTGSTALWTLLAFARREIGEVGQTLSTVIPGTANQLAAVQTLTFPNIFDPGSWLDWIQDTATEVGAILRNFFIPIFFNRTPIASSMQVETDLSLVGTTVTSAIPFTAYDPDGNAIVYSVPEKGMPGGPTHGSVTVNADGTFTYTLEEDFTGTDVFSFVANDDTDLHLHAWENLLNAAFGIFGTSFAGGHRDSATVTIFNNVDIQPDPNVPVYTAITGDFTVLTYNIAGLPFPLSSAEFPRITNTLEIGSRINDYADIVAVQEDFAYHTFLLANAAFPTQTAPQVPTWLWPIGVPFSDGLNTLSAFELDGLVRQAWFGCHADNCLTPKGFTYTRMTLPGGEQVDLYNAHMNTGGGSFTNADIAQMSNYIQQNSSGRAVIVTGDFNELYSDPGQTLTAFAEDNGFTDAWLELEYPGGLPPVVPTCDYADDCEQLDKIFYRSATALDPNDSTTSPVQLQATLYDNLGEEFLNGDGKDLSDHRPQAVTFSYTVRNNGPIASVLPG